jgi:hypothetical protein
MPIRANPVHQIKLPNDSKPRERRLEEGDDTRLADAISSNSAWYQSRLGKFGQRDKWSFCLTAARMAAEQEKR